MSGELPEFNAKEIIVKQLRWLVKDIEVMESWPEHQDCVKAKPLYEAVLSGLDTIKDVKKMDFGHFGTEKAATAILIGLYGNLETYRRYFLQSKNYDQSQIDELDNLKLLILNSIINYIYPD